MMKPTEQQAQGAGFKVARIYLRASTDEQDLGGQPRPLTARAESVGPGAAQRVKASSE
jgi:DNA invertase Pin-like site-specific DNA recombinase